MIYKVNLTNINFTKGRAGNKVTHLVYHYTANDGDTDENNAKYFKAVHRGASAHYFIDEDSVTQVVKDEDTAWHCGDNQKYTNGGATMKGKVRNVNSIGIELCSDKDSRGKYILTPETIKNGIELGQSLMEKYNIPIENVHRHFDVTGKICPEPFVRDQLQWKRFKERLVDEEVKTTVITAKMNGKATKLTSIVYNDENYVRLRDLADAQKDDKLEVDWNAAMKTVIIKSK